MYDRMKDNAHRLANVLESCTDDKNTIQALAHYLNYVPEQLTEDMKDLKQYIKRLEENL